MSIRVLIAESDRAAARLLEASLSRYGFEVMHADEGERAVAMFTPRAFDVVLLDVSLPRKSGIEAAKAIRTSPGGNQVGVVLTSSNTVSPEVVLELRRAQVDAWFNKPLSMRDLRDKLAELAHKYTGATSELLHVASGRRALAKSKKPPAARSSSPSAPSAPSSSPASKSQGVSRAAIAKATEPSEPRRPSSGAIAPVALPVPAVAAPSSQAPPTARLARADLSSEIEIESARPATPPSSAGFAVPPPTGSERVAPKEPPLGAEARRVEDMHASSRMMLALARARATGIYTLTLRDAEAKVAFIQGVMVGAMDTSSEHRLLSRLVRRGVLQEEDIEGVLTYSRENRLRAAEAVLALEHCDAETLLDELEQQAGARLVMAASWRGGEMRLVDDKAEVERLAISSFDAYEAVFRRFDQLSDPVMVSAWLERASGDEFVTSRDFEDGLVAYARVAPKSPLPSILFSRPPTLKALAAQIEQRAPADRDKLFAHVYGMWVAGLLRLPGDVIVDERAVPRPVRTEELDRAVPDKEACALVRSEWLRAQGRNYYDALGISVDISDEGLRQAVAAYREKLGSETLGKKAIGPVAGLADDLFALIEDIETTLLDPEQRSVYDAELKEREEPTSLELSIDADSHFLEGKLSLSHGNIRAAKEAFELAAGYASENAEYRSYLAWTEFLEGMGLVESAMASLRDAAEADHEAMRPMLLLGLAAERLGNLESARAAFEEAQRRAPGNPEIENALARIKREEP